jgi:hypothetical protein
MGSALDDIEGGPEGPIDAHARKVSEAVTRRARETVDHPAHYGGADNPYEAIKVIEAWELGFCLGNTVKYIARAGRKDQERTLEDLKKARWYLDRHIARLEREGR